MLKGNKMQIKDVHLTLIGTSFILYGIISFFYFYSNFHGNFLFIFLSVLIFAIVGSGFLILGMRCGTILGITFLIFISLLFTSPWSLLYLGLWIFSIFLLLLVGVSFESLRKEKIKQEEKVLGSVLEEREEIKFDVETLLFSVYPRLIELTFLILLYLIQPPDALIFILILTISESIIIMREEIVKNTEVKTKYERFYLISLIMFSISIISFLIAISHILPIPTTISIILSVIFIILLVMPFISFHLVLKNYRENRFSSLIIPLTKIILLESIIVFYIYFPLIIMIISPVVY